MRVLIKLRVRCNYWKFDKKKINEVWRKLDPILRKLNIVFNEQGNMTKKFRKLIKMKKFNQHWKRKKNILKICEEAKRINNRKKNLWIKSDLIKKKSICFTW